MQVFGLQLVGPVAQRLRSQSLTLLSASKHRTCNRVWFRAEHAVMKIRLPMTIGDETPRPGNRRRPANVLARAPVIRQLGGVRDPRHIRASELRPIGGNGRAREYADQRDRGTMFCHFGGSTPGVTTVSGTAAPKESVKRSRYIQFCARPRTDRFGTP